MIKPRIILASSSPRRIDILKEYKINFISKEHKIINEPEYSSGTEPCEFVKNIALDKAKSIENYYPDDFIIGSDTIVMFNALNSFLASLGKPTDARNAFNMINMLSGNIHNVYTGIALINKNRQIYESSYDKTEVKIKNLSYEEIYNYINKFKPFDKAGSYGIQDSQDIVESYAGSYKNVEGLCIEKLIPLLKKYNLM